MRIRRVGLWAAWAVVLLANAAAAVEVTLSVTDDAKTARSGGIVTTGVPFAKGAVKDVGRLSVSVGSKPVPAQFIQLAPWDDGSVRWALMDCQVDVPAGGSTELVVRDDGRNPAPLSPVMIEDGEAELSVSTGPMAFVVDKTSAAILKSLKVDGRELITARGRGLVIWAECPAQGTVRRSGRPSVDVPKYGPGTPIAAEPPGEVRVEQAGPMRAIITLRGRFPERVHKGLAGYTVRIYAYAGRKHLKIHLWLENDGAHGYTWEKNTEQVKREWMIFDGLALELGLDLGGPITAACEGATANGRLRVFQGVTRPTTNRGPAYRLEDMVYRITSGEKGLKSGQRTDGVVSLSGKAGRLTACVRDFWENYEKAIELEDSRLRIWLWPLEGQYPRRWNGYTVAQYACRMMAPMSPVGVYALPGGVHKGHQIALDFSGREPERTHAEIDRPLRALASAEYYAATEAAPGLFAPPAVHTGEEACDAKLDAWTRMTRAAADPASPYSLWEGRRRTGRANFWYGWMDFGDLSVPGSGYVSLHYDWPYVMLLGLVRTGDVNFLRLAEDMTQHRVDVDHCWSQREAEACRDLQRGVGRYTHFHCSRFTRSRPTVADNWLTGVVFYYMLTGEPKALECIERNAQALRRGWGLVDGSKGHADRRVRGDMQAVARAMFAFCAMHGLTAEKKWLDDAVRLFNDCVVPKWDSHGPHLHARQQIRSQDYTKDDIKYCYSIQAFCLLHHLTGDKKLFELLQAGCDAEFPENFFDAPLFLADLNAYVALKTGKADYVENAVEHWIEAFPESKCPPVYLPRNSQWSRRKAMFMRTGHLLQYYYWKKQGGGK